MLQAAATLSSPINSPVILASVQDGSNASHAGIAVLLVFEPVCNAAFSTAHFLSLEFPGAKQLSLLPTITT